MSFQIVLDTSTVFATNTALKDYTWGFNTGVIEEGDYLLSYSFTSGNIALATFATNGPTVLSVDFGVRPLSYLGSATTVSKITSVVGPVQLDWKSTTVGTYTANRMDCFPLLIKDLNKASNFIRLRLETNAGALITTGITSWFVVLYFEKVNK
jgi:hypothetical protein